MAGAWGGDDEWGGGGKNGRRVGAAAIRVGRMAAASGQNRVKRRRRVDAMYAYFDECQITDTRQRFF
jgi:hypothetical protein